MSVLWTLANVGMPFGTATSAMALIAALRSSVFITVKSPPEPTAMKTVLPGAAPWSTIHCTFSCVASTSSDLSSLNIVANGMTTPSIFRFASSTVIIRSSYVFSSCCSLTRPTHMPN